MRTLLFIVLIISASCSTTTKREIASISYEENFERIVNSDTQISTDVLESAFKRYQNSEGRIQNRRYVGIIDYSKHSSENRFFILDLDAEEVFSYLVAHGRGNDLDHDGVPEHFSNSYNRGAGEAPLGAFVTFQTYSKVRNRNRYFGIRIKGLDAKNSHAEHTGIVIQTSTVHPPLVRGSRTITSLGSYVVKISKFQEIENMLRDGAFVYVGK